MHTLNGQPRITVEDVQQANGKELVFKVCKTGAVVGGAHTLLVQFLSYATLTEVHSYVEEELRNTCGASWQLDGKVVFNGVENIAEEVRVLIAASTKRYFLSRYLAEVSFVLNRLRSCYKLQGTSMLCDKGPPRRLEASQFISVPHVLVRFSSNISLVGRQN